MGSDLLVVLILAVAPGVNDLPANTSAEISQRASSRRVQASRPLVVPSLVSTASAVRQVVSGDAEPYEEGPQISGLVPPSVAAPPAVVKTADAVSGTEFVSSTDACCCDECVAPRHHWPGMWGAVGLPSPHHPPGDMTQHIPYIAHPHNYYYFRPYNYFHIAKHQAEVMHYGGNPKHPYANTVFQRAYDRAIVPTEQRFPEPEPVTPPRLR